MRSEIAQRLSQTGETFTQATYTFFQRNSGLVCMSKGNMPGVRSRSVKSKFKLSSALEANLRLHFESRSNQWITIYKLIFGTNIHGVKF